MRKYISRVLSSDRGESYNVLTWPFLLATLAYGTGFVFFMETSGVGDSTLILAMLSFGEYIPLLWGITALITIMVGTSYLLFRTPPFGRISGLLGFMVWVFATLCWLQTGGWVFVFAIGIPNMWFWVWQYFSLSKFKRQDSLDTHTMKMYDAGMYDDEEHPAASKIDREDNRKASNAERDE